METFFQDVRQAVRMLARNPGFAIIAVLALALGIGPNVAIFSVVNTLLLTPPPYQDPNSIVTIDQTREVAGLPKRTAAISSDDFQTWRSATRMFEQMAMYVNDTTTLTGVSEPVRLNGARVSPALFPLLRVQPLMGRFLREEEEKAGSNRVVMLSYNTWANRFGKAPGVLNSYIKLDGNDYAVVGIMRPEFEFPNNQAEYWAPLVLEPPLQSATVHRIMMAPAVARLRPGATIAQAQAEGSTLLQRRSDGFMQPSARGAGGPAREGEPPRPGAAAEIKKMMRPPDTEMDLPARKTPGKELTSPGQPRQRGMQRVFRAGPETQESPGPQPGLPGRGEGPEQRQVMRMAGPGQTPSEGTRGAGPGAGSGFMVTSGSVQLTTLREQSMRQVRPALLVLVVAVGLVLLVACANVANLLLSRAVDRQKEIAIRVSMGAGRMRIIRQMLTESVLLGLLGGMAGFLLGYWGITLLRRLTPGNIPHLEDISIDLRAFAFSVALSLVTGVLFGLAPALKSSRTDLMNLLKEGEAQASAGLHPFRRNKVRSLLVVVEFALALVLLVGAGLLANSFVRLIRQKPGYDPEGVLSLQLSLPRTRYAQAEAQLGFYDQLLDSVRRLPGVQAAGATNSMPMSSAMMAMSFAMRGGPRSTDPAAQTIAGIRLVSPGFIKAMSIRLLNGRDFTDQDREGASPVAIVNESLVQRFLNGENPVGRQFSLGDEREIIGVVADVRPQGLDSKPMPEMYLPVRQFSRMFTMEGPMSSMTLVARTNGDPMALVPAIRAQLASLDPQLPMYNISSLKQRISNSVAQPRFYAVLLGIFAGLALVLAAVGIYGVFSYQVAQCTREIGIRMALGAQPSNVLGLVMRQGALLSMSGIVLGLGAAWAGTRYLSSLLFGVEATDPVTYAAAALFMTVVAAAATYLPAHRATTINPVLALRQE